MEGEVERVVGRGVRGGGGRGDPLGALAPPPEHVGWERALPSPLRGHPARWYPLLSFVRVRTQPDLDLRQERKKCAWGAAAREG